MAAPAVAGLMFGQWQLEEGENERREVEVGVGGGGWGWRPTAVVKHSGLYGIGLSLSPEQWENTGSTAVCSLETLVQVPEGGRGTCREGLLRVMSDMTLQGYMRHVSVPLSYSSYLVCPQVPRMI